MFKEIAKRQEQDAQHVIEFHRNAELMSNLNDLL